MSAPSSRAIRAPVLSVLVTVACAGLTQGAQAHPPRSGPIAAPPEVKDVSAQMVRGGTNRGRMLVTAQVGYGDVKARPPRISAPYHAQVARAQAQLSYLARLTGRLRVTLHDRSGSRAVATSMETPLDRDAAGHRRTILQSALLTRAQTRRLIAGHASPRDLTAQVAARETLNLNRAKGVAKGVDYADADQVSRLPVRVGGTERRLSPTVPSSIPCSPQPPLRLTYPGDSSRPRGWEGTYDAVYADPTTFFVCNWQTGAKHQVPIPVVRPKHGTLGFTTSTGNEVIAIYEPDRGYIGPDQFQFALSQQRFGPNDYGDLYTINVRAHPFRMRAMGDSVTAGFGYWGHDVIADGVRYDEGQAFPPGENALDTGWLLLCKPGDRLDDRCSSNSAEHFNNDGRVTYNTDYGLGNNISWAAQLANANHIPLWSEGQQTFANYAVTGSEPKDWEYNDPYRSQTAEFVRILSSDPDLTVMTLGANPLLGELLLSSDTIGCKWDSLNGKLRECIRRKLDQVQLERRMKLILMQLLWSARSNHIIVSLYPTVFPALITNIFTVGEIDFMESEINNEIAKAVEHARKTAKDLGYGGNRVRLSTPPPFYFGANTNGHDPYFCNGHYVDGPSRQSYITQHERLDSCPSNNYWVLSNDSGIHPTWRGYEQIAASAQDQIRDMHLPLPLPPSPSDNGRIVSKLDYKCVDVPWPSNGIRLWMWPCDGSRRFVLAPSGELKPVGAPDKCVDATSGGNGADVVLEGCSGGANQRWRVVGSEIRGINDRCLDLFGFNRSDGAHLKIYDCTGDTNQKWELNGVVAAGANSPSR